MTGPRVWTSWQIGHVIRSGAGEFYAYGADGYWYCISHKGCPALPDEPRVSAIIGLPDRTPTIYQQCRTLLTNTVADLVRRGAQGTTALSEAELFLNHTAGDGDA